MTTEELIARTIAWGEAHEIDNMWSQASKVAEEWGETVGEMNHGRFGDAFRDGIGDVFISLTIYAHICGVDVERCWGDALEEVEKRTGKTVNGNFIKNEDLDGETNS